MIKLNTSMVYAMREKILGTSEQLALYNQCKPFIDAVTERVASQSGGKNLIHQTALLGHEKAAKSLLSGGYKSLNLEQAWLSIPKTPELLRAKRAHDKLITRNLPMAISIASKFYRGRKCTNTQGDDYAQMGAMALTYASYLYTPTSPKTGKPVKFSTYAKPWIEALVREEQQRSTLIYDKRRKELPPRFYTEVRDESGDYVDIFSLIDYQQETSISEALLTVENGKIDFNPVVKKLLTPQELQSLTLSPSTPLEASMMLGLPLSEDAVSQAKEFKSQSVAKLKGILEDMCV